MNKELKLIKSVRKQLPKKELIDMDNCRNDILNVLKQHGATSVLALSQIFYEFQSGILNERDFCNKTTEASDE